MLDGQASGSFMQRPLNSPHIAIAGLYGAWLFTRSRAVEPKRAILLSAGNRHVPAQEAPSEYRYTLHRG